jgi:hypothetical protein
MSASVSAGPSPRCVNRSPVEQGAGWSVRRSRPHPIHAAHGGCRCSGCVCRQDLSRQPSVRLKPSGMRSYIIYYCSRLSRDPRPDREIGKPQCPKKRAGTGRAQLPTASAVDGYAPSWAPARIPTARPTDSAAADLIVIVGLMVAGLTVPAPGRGALTPASSCTSVRMVSFGQRSESRRVPSFRYAFAPAAPYRCRRVVVPPLRSCRKIGAARPTRCVIELRSR